MRPGRTLPAACRARGARLCPSCGQRRRRAGLGPIEPVRLHGLAETPEAPAMSRAQRERGLQALFLNNLRGGLAARPSLYLTEPAC